MAAMASAFSIDSKCEFTASIAVRRRVNRAESTPFGKARSRTRKPPWAGQFCLDHSEGTAILQGGIRLGVERFLLRHSARQEDMQDAFGLRGFGRTGCARRGVLGGLGFLPLEQVAEDEAHRSERTDSQ